MTRIVPSQRATPRWLVLGLLVMLGVIGLRHGGRPTRRTTPELAARSAQRVLPVAVMARSAAPEASEPQLLRLEGQVTDDEDLPAGGADVTLGARTVRSEADGSFAFDDVPAGSYDVSAARGDAFAEVQQVELDASSDPVTLKLKRGPTLIVQVVDEQGRPFAGATVEVGRRSFTTPAGGAVRVRGVDVDDEYVDVQAAGRARVHRRVVTSADPGATVECTIALRAGATMSGVVLDDHGQRVAGATVELELAVGAPDERGDVAFSDEQGAWQFESLGTARYVLRASSDRHVAGGVVEVAHDGGQGTTGVVLRVEPGAQIAGVVVDADGRPLAEARVVTGHRMVTSDAQGAFLVEGLEPRSYDVSATTATHGGPSQEVTLAARARAQITLVLAPSSLAGTVVDRHGQPVDEAVVFATSEADRHFYIARTDEVGRFDVGGLPAGRYRVFAERSNSHVDSTSLEVTTTQRSLVLVVPELARVTGRVLLDGAPVAHFRFAITDSPDRASLTEVYDAGGRFTERDAEPGTRTIVISGDGLVTRVVPGVVIVEGQTTSLGDVQISRAP